MADGYLKFSGHTPAPIMLDRFSGVSDPTVWVNQAEHYFNFCGFSKDMWLSLPYLYFDGEALAWFNWLYRNKQFYDWKHFTDKLACHYRRHTVTELGLSPVPDLLLQLDANLSRMSRHLDTLQNTLSAFSKKLSNAQACPDLTASLADKCDIEEVAEQEFVSSLNEDNLNTAENFEFPHMMLESHMANSKVRVKKEQEEKVQKGKEKAEACLYTMIKVARDEDLGEQIGKEIYFDLVDHDKVRTFRIQKQMLFTEFKEEVAKAFGIPVQFQRFWLWAKRQNHTYRPDRVLTAQEEIQPVGELREVSNKWNSNELKLFLEVELCLDLRPLHPPGKTTREEILIFLKLYDPLKETIRYVGRLSVKGSGKPLEIKTRLKELAGFSPDEEIELFEEIKFEPSVMCEKIDSNLSFCECELEDGDIICFQKSLQNQCSEQYRFPEVPSFLEYMHNCQPKEHKMLVPSSDFSTKKPQPVEVAPADTASTVDVAESRLFTWTVDNFSRLNVKKLYSEAFSIGGYKWRMLMFPKGNNKKHLSVYLDVGDAAALPNGWSRYAQFSLAVLDQVHGKFTVRKDTQHQFNAREKDWGFTSFIPLTELHDPARGYLVNDKIMLEADFSMPKSH